MFFIEVAISEGRLPGKLSIMITNPTNDEQWFKTQNVKGVQCHAGSINPSSRLTAEKDVLAVEV